MKLYLQRQDGLIKVKQRVRKNLPSGRDRYGMMRTIKTVKDTFDAHWNAALPLG